MCKFNRENRYLVAKVRDVEAALSEVEQLELQKLLNKVETYRTQSGKEPLVCVVVESDWPNYESTWDSIEHTAATRQAN